MTDNEAIAAVRRGERCVTRTTLPLEGFKGDPARCRHSYRTVACNYDDDVIECRHCGNQKVTHCDYDEDMA